MRHLIAVLAILPAPAFSDVDPCLIGQWVPDMDKANETYRALMPVPSTLSGELTQTVAADGKVIVAFNDLTALLDQAGMGQIINRLNGTFDLSLHTNGDAMAVEILSSDVEVAISMKAADAPEQPMLVKPLDIGDIVDRSLEIGYTCDGDTVTVQSRDDTPTFAPVWYRVK